MSLIRVFYDLEYSTLSSGARLCLREVNILAICAFNYDISRAIILALVVSASDFTLRVWE